MTSDFIERPRGAAKYLGVARQTLYAWVELGILEPPIKIGSRAVGWRRSTLEAFLKNREAAAGEKSDA